MGSFKCFTNDPARAVDIEEVCYLKMKTLEKDGILEIRFFILSYMILWHDVCDMIYEKPEWSILKNRVKRYPQFNSMCTKVEICDYRKNCVLYCKLFAYIVWISRTRLDPLVQIESFSQKRRCIDFSNKKHEELFRVQLGVWKTCSCVYHSTIAMKLLCHPT